MQVPIVVCSRQRLRRQQAAAAAADKALAAEKASKVACDEAAAQAERTLQARSTMGLSFASAQECEAVPSRAATDTYVLVYNE